jgi:O-antigen ligase
MRQDLARSSFAVFLALSIVLPFLNYYRVSPVPTFYSELAAGIFFLAACAAGASLLPARQSVDALTAVLCCGLLAVLGYQVVSGQYYEFMMSWSAWAVFLCLFFLALVFGQLAAADAQFKALVVERVSGAFLLAALFNAFSQVAQVTEWSLQVQPLIFIPGEAKYSFYTCTPAGNVAQLNQANALAWLGIAGLLYAFVAGKARTPFFVVGLAVLLFSSALTSSRMAWLMAGALALLLVVTRSGLGWSFRRSVTMGGLLVGGLFLATAARQLLVGGGCASSLGRMLGEFAASSAGQGAEYGVRLEMVRQALMLWWRQPFLGVGVGKFMGGTFALEPSRDAVQPLDFYPHNVALEILVSFGIVGAALLLACSAFWLSQLWRNRNESAQQWPLIAGLVVISIPALLETALWYLHFLLPFGLMLGMALGPPGSSAWSLRLSWRWLFPAVALLALPLFTFATRDHMRAEHVIWLSGVALGGGELSGAAAERVPAAVHDLTFFAVWGEHEALRFGQESQGDLPAQRAANQRLLDNIPSPHIVARQIMLENLAGRPDEARDLFRRMMVFYPNHYEPVAIELRRRVGAHREAGSALAKIIDEELARPLRARDGN